MSLLYSHKKKREKLGKKKERDRAREKRIEYGGGHVTTTTTILSGCDDATGLDPIVLAKWKYILSLGGGDFFMAGWAVG